MDETQREPRVADTSQRSEDHREQDTSTTGVARLLANPRRVRVD
jgi:hypothetical protein